MSIGKCPRPKIFKAYAELEMQLGEVERCRKIFEKQVDLFQQNSDTWVMYAEFEGALGELDRARAIFSLAVGLNNSEGASLDDSAVGGAQLVALDMPEKVWKAYIDFEVENG